MKKLALILLFLSMGLIGVVKADPLYDQCMDEKPYGTNLDWGDCGGNYLRRVDKQLNGIWKVVLASYDGHAKVDMIRKSMIEEQRAWIKYKENICDVYSSGYYGREGQVLGAPLCQAKLIEDRIKELRTYYCFDDKCGFDKPLEQDFADIGNSETLLNHIENPPTRPTDSNEARSAEDDAELMQQYGINFEKDAERDQERFKAFQDKACQFTRYLKQSETGHFLHSACVSAIIGHRIEQLSFDTYEGAIDYQSYANLGLLLQKDNWIFGCDQSFTCTAIGYDEAFEKGQYIAIHWQYNSNTAPDIRFVVASLDKKVQSGMFSYSFPDSKTDFPLVKEKVNAPVIMAAHIEAKNADGFLQALLRDSRLEFGLQHKDMPVSHLDLKPFAEFYQNQKQNVDTLYGQQQPQLPHIKAITFKTRKLARPKPQDEYDICLQSRSDDYSLKASNGDEFAARCNDAYPFAVSGDNRNTFQVFYSFQKKEKNSTLTAPRFDTKTNWRLQEDWPQQTMLRDIYFDKNTLHSIQRFGPSNDCGRDYGYSYDGTTWNLSSYSTMPVCSLVQREDWPVLYRTIINTVNTQ